MARFASLIAPVPADIDVIFRLADHRSFLAAFGSVMILSLVAELLIQPYLSRAIDRFNRKKNTDDQSGGVLHLDSGSRI